LVLAACQQSNPPPPSATVTTETRGQIASSAVGYIRTGCQVVTDANDLISLVPYLGTAEKIATVVCKAVAALPPSKAPKVAGAPVTVKVDGVLVHGTRA
jgi:hypothetical protein